VTSIGLGSQIVFALFSGILVDKLGRRIATVIFDTLSWAVPCLLWAVSQNIYYFIAAAIFNGMWRVGMTGWTCLLVEDTEPEKLIDIYSWIYISGMLAAFFAPLAGFLIQTYTLIPTLRGIYIFAFVFMTTKFLILFRISHETKLGVIRLRETREQSILTMLGEYREVFKQVMRTRSTLYTIAILLVMTIAYTINSTFWAVIVTGKMHVPAQYVAFYPFARSIIMLAFFFLVIPRISDMQFKRPMMTGFACYVVSHLVLVSLPEKSYVLLLVSTFLEACGYALLNPQLDKMMVVTVDAAERARILAIIYVIVIILTTPFGWIAGELSTMNRAYPFILNIVLFSVGGLLVWLAGRKPEKALLDAGIA
jgi:MFS family permease